MRIAVWLGSIVLIALAVRAPAWAHAEVEDTHAEVGLHGATECARSRCTDEAFDDFQGIGRAGAREGAIAFYAGLAAVAALIAAVALRVHQRAWPARVALVVPLLADVGAAAIYAGRLDAVSWLSVGWPPYLTIVACMASSIAALLPPASPTSPAAPAR